MATELIQGASLPAAALEALQQDATLPICVTCGTQYPAAADPTSDCPICIDPRQYVPESGQQWTSLAELGSKHRNTLRVDKDDDRVTLVCTEPPFGIGQTPILIETANGSYLWDCSAYLSLQLVSYLSTLRHPLKAIAISHPHFYSTSLTWARALRVPLYLNELDKEWYMRAKDVREDDKVTYWRDTVELGPGVNVVECGGHFPGSSMLHWDRLAEPAPDILPRLPRPVSGLLLTADTMAIQPTQRGFTFLWSYPNMIPLRPEAVLAVQRAVAHLPFDQACSSWPNRVVRSDAKRVLDDSVRAFLAAMGWWVDEQGSLQAIQSA